MGGKATPAQRVPRAGSKRREGRGCGSGAGCYGGRWYLLSRGRIR